MHEPRGKKGLGSSYAVSNRGACHLQAEHDDTFEDPKWLRPEIGLDKNVDRLDVERQKAKNVKNLLCPWSLYDSLSVCKFTCFPEGGISLQRLAEMVNAATGWQATPNDLLKVGERALNLSRTFNVREGFSRKDDALPKRLMEPLSDGPYKGQAITEADLNGMIDNLYEFLRWNKDAGAPTRDKLAELGIGYVADVLKLT
jgi:aldehyde:ferredoxin oxidoreductase